MNNHLDDETLADLLVMIGLIEKYDDLSLPLYGFPMGKMSFLSEGIVRNVTTALRIEEMCLAEGFAIRLSQKGNKYTCVVEGSWMTSTSSDLYRAKVEACALTLEGILKNETDKT